VHRQHTGRNDRTEGAYGGYDERGNHSDQHQAERSRRGRADDQPGSQVDPRGSSPTDLKLSAIARVEESFAAARTPESYTQWTTGERRTTPQCAGESTESECSAPIIRGLV